MHNLVLVEEGYAKVLTVSPNDKYADRFEAAEEEASRQGTGPLARCERSAARRLPVSGRSGGASATTQAPASRRTARRSTVRSRRHRAIPRTSMATTTGRLRVIASQIEGSHRRDAPVDPSEAEEAEASTPPSRGSPSSEPLSMTIVDEQGEDGWSVASVWIAVEGGLLRP